MFELIALLFATVCLFALGAILAAILASITWFFLRGAFAPSKRLILTAALIPLVSAGYMWLCILSLPGESLFGDISQPLPNGYLLEALGKMPDFASISNPRSPNSYNGLSESIGKLAVYGPLIAGQYSHPFASFDAAPNEPFFIFDTRSGQHKDLPTLTDLQAVFGHPVLLTEVQFFRSQEPAYRAKLNINKLIMFGPPIIALGILTIAVIRHTRRTQPYSPNIYT